jgi:hypothetical protein
MARRRGPRNPISDVPTTVHQIRRPKNEFQSIDEETRVPHSLAIRDTNGTPVYEVISTVDRLDLGWRAPLLDGALWRELVTLIRRQ